MQATWRNVKKAVRGIPGAEGAQLADVEDMADLCPSVVILRNRNRHAVPGSCLHCSALSWSRCVLPKFPSISCCNKTEMIKNDKQNDMIEGRMHDLRAGLSLRGQCAT